MNGARVTFKLLPPRRGCRRVAAAAAAAGAQVAYRFNQVDCRAGHARLLPAAQRPQACLLSGVEGFPTYDFSPP